MYCGVEHIARSVRFDCWKRSTVAIFTAYFDESDSPRASVVAGIVGEAEQLSHFNREWTELLQSENLTSFHMKDFAHSNGEFRNWKNDISRRKDFIGRIIGIISRRVRISIGILIDRVAYQNVAHRDIFANFYKTEYTACAFLSLLRTSSWARRNRITDRIAFVFDNGNPKRTDFQRAFDMANVPPIAEENNFGSLTFADDRFVSPLQAADFIAYEFCKLYTDVEGKQIRVRQSLTKFLERIPNDLRIGNEKLLLDLAERGDQLPDCVPPVR